MKKKLKGNPASRGRVRGRVYKAFFPEDDGMPEGAILVVRTTDPRWLPMMRKAKGIITERGGILCHAAITAREFGIPCVTGVRDVLKLLNTGDDVELNGNEGVVYVYTAH